MQLRSISAGSSPVLSFICLGILALATTENQAIAQQGSECLACHTGLPATEHNLITEDTTDQASTCDYSSADLFDGWGWNPVTLESCPPLEDTIIDAELSACDYSNANQYDGWGWNPELLESCPPLEPEDPHSAFPVCSAQFFDSDGDGFGWENEASCIVTADSAPPPVFTNRETGNEVDLVRAHWDPNTDIANRNIQCDLHYYDSYEGRYIQEFYAYDYGSAIPNTTYPGYQFRHQPLPPTRPFNGWIEKPFIISEGQRSSANFSLAPDWTVDDGRYIGPTILQTPYIELVTRPNNSKAIRHWINRDDTTALDLQFVSTQVRRDGYYECRDTAGRDFEPTGAPGVPTTSPVTVSELVFSATPNPQQQDPQSIVNLETGQPVPLTKAYWNYNADIAVKDIFCEAYFWEEGDEYFEGGYMPLAILVDYRFPRHFTNTGSRLFYWEQFPDDDSPQSFIVNNGVLSNGDGGTLELSAIFNSEYVEVSGNTTTFWSSSEEFTECSGMAPTGTAPVVTDNNVCDYSSASRFNGWGWNPVTMESCPPIEESNTTPADHCDYSSATSQGGWGWNPMTMQSCPPLDQPDSSNSNCDYTDAARNDGWGWDPVAQASCSPRI